MFVTGLTAARFATAWMAPVIGVAAVLLVVYSYVEWRRDGGAGSSTSN